MTRDEAREAAKVLQHYADGGDVQIGGAAGWRDVSGQPTFNFGSYDYRIKPELAEGWATVDEYGNHPKLYASEHDARFGVEGDRRVIHWREVSE